MDLYLRTNTEAEMEEALEASGLAVERNMGDGLMALMPVRGVAIDWIGEIPPVYEGEVMVKPGRSGVHVNIRLSIPLSAEQIANLPLIDPAPTSPYCKFA